MGLVIIMHAIVPHHHHYHSHENKQNSCKSEEHGSEKPDMHCFAFNDLIVQKANSQLIINNLPETDYTSVSDESGICYILFLHERQIVQFVFKEHLTSFAHQASCPVRGSPFSV